MSKQDARKVTIVEELLAGRFTNKQSAQLLGLSVRQVQRLKARAAVHGSMSILHRSRGVAPANKLDPTIATKLVNVYQSELHGYNFSHATDVFAEEKGIFVSVSTVSRYLKAKGNISSKAKRRRKKKHRSRDARQQEGELVQMDASKFDWLGNGSYLHLHGAVDDATGKVLALYFEKEETFQGYSELMLQMNQNGHLPREIYTDARTVFVYNKKDEQALALAEELQGKTKRLTQFARALQQLNILLIIAHSPQAKGCIERLWGTLQDRLSKDMKRKGISTVEEANFFLKQYITYYNHKFAVQAANPEKAYLPKQNAADLQLIFAKHESRVLDNGLTFSYKGQRFSLPAAGRGKKIPASPHDTITIATSSRIGMQVIFKGLVFKPVLLKRQPKTSIIQNQQDNTALSISTTVVSPVAVPPKTHPWRTYSNYFYSKDNRSNIPKTNRGDIIADQLTTV